MREFRRNTALSSALAIVSLVVAGVAFDHESWLALAMCLLVYVIALYFTFLIEKAKKKYDVQTYREIRASMEWSSPSENSSSQFSSLSLRYSCVGVQPEYENRPRRACE